MGCGCWGGAVQKRGKEGSTNLFHWTLLFRLQTSVYKNIPPPPQLISAQSTSSIRNMPSSIWGQLASFFFLMAAVFSDLLLLRFCLIAANTLLVVAAALGMPLWPNLASDNGVATDVLIWASLSLVLHLWAFVRLLWDERPMHAFPEADEEALYQFFAVRGGITRTDFVSILERGSWLRVAERGTEIPCSDRMHILVQGAVDCKIRGWKRKASDPFNPESVRILLTSGQIFDLMHANVFKLPIGFFNQEFHATSVVDNTVLFSFPLAALADFANGPPVIVQVWRNMVAFAVADVAHRQTPEPTGSPTPAEFGKRHPDFSLPPPTKPLSLGQRIKGFLWWILSSMDPRPPQGLRHFAVPHFVENPNATITKEGV